MDNLNNIEQIDTSWIESLALDEINMEESGIVQFNEHLDPNYFLEESSVEFMNLIKDRFEVLVEKFNLYRGGQNGSTIKIFRISNTINDFMLYRNALKLIVARRSNDRISLGFLTTAGGVYSARTNPGLSSVTNHAHEVKAHVGPFKEVSWRFEGDSVNVDSLVKHYLTEFTKLSAQ
jgi:hypothetical protein